MTRAAKPVTADPPVDVDPLRLELQLCFSLYTASSLMTRLYRPLLQPLGLTYPQYLALLALWERSPLSQGEVGKRLRLDSGTLTPLFKRLERAGLVSRRRDPEDERRLMIDLTPKGLSLRQQALTVPGEAYCRLQPPTHDLGALKARLDRLIESLEGAGLGPEGA
ncbi:MarR family winged helix-turn-helix transcriptional regulator [Phenylobacterium sp.]|uniref:MarR family winged helix-turn-helix transcriptional regulator n=1 Tax=Phenylobacterium sp. TaxID=1871053 RepID=UPI0027374AF9|nr:MarR family transcriptional regulator [Phenylobacterium sp.]MDP3853829.1 MarR family transcriptional regulator [Phenylobacterium sp.]